MSRLAAFKKFYRLDEAAARLTAAFGETVSLSDILQFVVEDRLQISALYLHQSAKEIALCTTLFNWFGGGENDPSLPLIRTGGKLDTRKGVMESSKSIHDHITHLDGVYRLYMQGPLVSGYVQHLLMGSEGDEFPLTAFDGVIVLDDDGSMFELCQRFDWSEEQLAARAKARKQANLADAPELAYHHKDNYYPSMALPPLHQLVLRTADLLQFELSVVQKGTNETPDSDEPNPKRKNGMLRLILGMAIDGYGYDVTSSSSSVPREIAEALANVEGDFEIDEDTVRDYLSEATGRPKRKYSRAKPK